MHDTVKSYLEKRARKGKIFLTCSSASTIITQKEITCSTLWDNVQTLLRKAYHHATDLTVREGKHPILLASLAFVFALIGLSSISLVGQNAAWTAEAHITRPSLATLHHVTSRASSTKASLAPLANYNRALDPVIIHGQWYCQPPYTLVSQKIDNGTNGVINFKNSCIMKNLTFPCSDLIKNGQPQPNENIIGQDWLSGDASTATGPNAPHAAGHFTKTYPEDTYAFPEIATLFGYMEGLSFLLIGPSAMLLGYNIMLGASSFRYAGALEGLSRVLLGGLAVGVSFTLIQMLLNLESTVTIAIGQLHAELPFPRTVINGIPIPYTLATEPANRFPGSYRGIIVPMSRWGCAANDFIGLFSPQFMTGTLASVVPIFGDFTHLAGTATSLSDMTQRIGQMVMMVLSILLWVQVFVRIIILNYYILTAPLSFGCWALPGGTGQRVVGIWFKGFFSVLFVQALQLFILTTLPLILPALPQIPADNVGLIQSFLLEFPPILALSVTLMAPTLIGASATKVLGTAGSMAGQTIIVIGNAASQVV